MRFFLDTDDPGDRLIFPIEPEDVEISGQAQPITFESARLGQIAYDMQTQPERIRWSSYFPDSAAQPRVHDWAAPEDLIRRIEEWRQNRSIRHLRISETEISVDVRIEEFTRAWGHWGGPRYTIGFVRAQDIRVKIFDSPMAGGRAGTRAQVRQVRRRRETPRRYIVRQGDTLYSIAKQLLGSGTRAREIATLNRLGVVGTYALSPGRELRLPVR